MQDSKSMRLIVDSTRHLVIKDSAPINDLTRREFQILWYLCQEPGRVFTRNQIFQHIWGDPLKTHERTVDMHVVQLRRKIDKTLIKSIIGVGYKITLDKSDIQLIA